MYFCSVNEYLDPQNLPTIMTLSNEYVFLTDDKEGFRECREKRTVTSSATMTILLCKAGYIDVYYRGEMVRIRKNDLFVRVPDFSHELGRYEMSPDFEFMQVTFDSSIYAQIMFDHMRVEPNWYAKQEYIKQNPIFPLDGLNIDFFNTYYHALSLQLQTRLTEYRKQIMMLIARSAVMEMLNYMDQLAVLEMKDKPRMSVNQSDYTFHRFTQLLQQYPHEREVQWYAKQLNITPKYLSEICKERSGKSAGEWIVDITVSELRHYLHNTTLPIREISRLMDFPNASFFSQYVKKHMGSSPNKYRKLKRV